MNRIVMSTAPLLLAAIALAGCAGNTAAPEPSSSAAADCDATIVVDFGVLDEPGIDECVSAGPAVDALDAAGITTEGTADYGDAVVCRVNGQPSSDVPVEIEGQESFVETCATLNSVAYWALWVKASADADWEYAQEGLATLELEPGQSVGLVYTVGTDSVPPGD